MPLNKSEFSVDMLQDIAKAQAAEILQLRKDLFDATQKLEEAKKKVPYFSFSNN